MVKIYCDKCEAEIKNKYYTFNIYECNTNPQYNISVYCDASEYNVSALSDSRKDMLEVLNSTRMYCKNCRDKIEAFMYNRHE